MSSTAQPADGAPEELHDGGKPSGDSEADGVPTTERAGKGKGKRRNWTIDETLAAVTASLRTEEIIRTQLHVGKTPGRYDAIALRSTCVHVARSSVAASCGSL